MNTKTAIYRTIDVGSFASGFAHGFANGQGLDAGIAGYASIAGPAAVRAAATGMLSQFNLTGGLIKAQTPENHSIVTPEFIDDTVVEIHQDNPKIKSRDSKVNTTLALGTGAYAAALAAIGYGIGYAAGNLSK